MSARRWIAAALAAVTLTGCGSAADVASSDPNEAPASGQDQTSSGPTKDAKSPEPTTSSAPATPTESSPSSPSSGPGPRREPRQLPNVVGALPTFLTPSRNIGCAISSGGARCDIRQHVYREPKRPAGCQGAYGQSLLARTWRHRRGADRANRAGPSLGVPM